MDTLTRVGELFGDLAQLIMHVNSSTSGHRMRALLNVLPAPGLENGGASANKANCWRFKHSSRSRLSNDSMNALSRGLPGRRRRALSKARFETCGPLARQPSASLSWKHSILQRALEQSELVSAHEGARYVFDGRSVCEVGNHPRDSHLPYSVDLSARVTLSAIYPLQTGVEWFWSSSVR